MSNKLTKSWLVPLGMAGVLFFAVRPTFAQVVEREANLAQYLTANDVEVGTEAVDEHSQVYYLFEKKKTYVSRDGQNKRHPHSSGEYIVWAGDINGAGQIYLYHIPTERLVQITSSSTNLKPNVSKNGQVVWERWIDESWQVFFFDGVKVSQLTSGDLSINPDIDDDFISYGRRDISGTWRSVVYSISKREAIEVAIGISSKRPKVRDGKIILAGTGREEVFPLTVDDLFLLDLLGPLSSNTPQTVTEEEIIEELEATLSAQVIELSPSPTSTPEATPNP